ncbi:MAG: DUF5808 domain-containing protein [Kineosporiaceae bacterium]
MSEKKDGPRDRPRQSGGNGALTVIVLVIAAVAVRRQLRLPRAERTWHGTVDVPVPYDFRRPTLERLRRSFWAPADPRLVTPMAFGVGWSVNLARLLRRSSRATEVEPS